MSRLLYVTILAALAAVAASLATAYAAAEYYELYEQDPHIHVSNGDLTTYGTNPFGQTNFNLSWTVHASDDGCVEKVEFSPDGSYWANFTPRNWNCSGTFGMGYGGADDPGSYYYYMRATDDAGNYGVVKVPFTLP